MEEEQRIMDFLSGAMTESEKQLFLKEIDSNEELKAEVEHYRHIRNMLNDDRTQFSAAVSEIISENQPIKRRPIYWVAASVSVLITLLAIYLWKQDADSVTLLADQYLEPHKDILTSRSGNEFEIDLSSYKNGNYQQAAIDLQKQLDESYQPVKALYLGISYLLSDNPNRANEVLTMIEKDQVVFSDDVNWYQSLALIKLNQMEEAKTLLNMLIEEQTIYRKKAEELLSLMD